MTGIGHNGGPPLDDAVAPAGQLRSIVERIESVTAEKDELAEDVRGIYAEAKGNGYDAKAIREIIKLRKQDKQERDAHQALVDTYQNALGML